MKKPLLTNKKSYDILLYCISMDKSPLPALRFNRMNQICFEIWGKMAGEKKVYPKDNFGRLRPSREKSSAPSGGVNKDRGD